MKRVKEGKYSGYTLYFVWKWNNEICWSCSKKGWKGDGRRMMEWVNLI
jgi:hypothetical protein